MMLQLRDLSVLILGLGTSGLSMARWCARQGAKVTVQDTRNHPPQLDALQREMSEIAFISASPDAVNLEQATYHAIFSSPGVNPASYAALLKAAKDQNIFWGSELTLFIDALTQLKQTVQYAPKIIAITGTNGKTTVTSLSGHLVAAAGFSVKVAGNIGPALLDTLFQAESTQALPSVWVLELSSFQLNGVSDFDPTVAAILNITQDHLDWHPTMADYAEAKGNIFGRHTLRVLNRDDEAVMAFKPPAVTSSPKEKHRIKPDPFITFGSNLPIAPGDFGLDTNNGTTWLVRSNPDQDAASDGSSSTHTSLDSQRFMPADALRIQGRHNACNALAALALCQSVGCSLSSMLYALREYQGEPHRVQSVGIVDDVEYIDDSKGTNVGATIAAINGLGEHRKLVLILGGDGKGQDFSLLKEPISHHVKAVMLIGKDTPIIQVTLKDTNVPMTACHSLESAVEKASQAAGIGDAVLLSPACASWDMFNDYAHRAQVFVHAVQELAMHSNHSLRADA